MGTARTPSRNASIGAASIFHRDAAVGEHQIRCGKTRQARDRALELARGVAPATESDERLAVVIVRFEAVDAARRQIREARRRSGVLSDREAAAGLRGGARSARDTRRSCPWDPRRLTWHRVRCRSCSRALRASERARREHRASPSFLPKNDPAHRRRDDGRAPRARLARGWARTRRGCAAHRGRARDRRALGWARG